MENFGIASPHHQGGGGGMAPPAQQQQLPPQMFTTAAQLLDLTDKKLLVVLRDGRKLFGVLRSWDQFANIVLQSTTERIFAPLSPQDMPTTDDDTTISGTQPQPQSQPQPQQIHQPQHHQNEQHQHQHQQQPPKQPPPRRGFYADILHGMFLVRGENVLLLGEVDLDRDDDAPPGYELDTVERVRRLVDANRARERGLRKRRAKTLTGLGFEGDDMGEAVFL